MTNKLVIYHNNCYDGVTAAWVCKHAFGDVEFIACNYSDPPPNVKGKDVFIVDFSFKRPVMRQLIRDADYVTVLDHHATAEKELKGLEKEVLIEMGKNCTIIFDMDRSGAGITWDYICYGRPRPRLIGYIEDRDLWRFQLLSSKKVNAFIQSFDINLETWIHNVVPAFEMRSLEEITKEGESLLRLENKYIKQICNNAKLKRIGEYIAPYVQTSILMSEVCDYLIHNYDNGKYPFAFYSFERKDGKFQYGLRSRSDFDVSIIAKAFGGGGHKQAAGFELDKELP